MITALMLGALALTLALTLAGMSFSHLTISSRLSNISQSRSLAEAAVSKAIERVVSTEGEAFSPDSALQGLSLTPFPGAPGGTAKLTFDPAVANAQDLPLSTNNIKSDESKEGYGGRLVPPNSIHFVGVGSHNGVTRRVECIIHFPAYQFALGAKGKVFSRGAMIIAGADEPSDVLPSVGANLTDSDPDDLLPGHLASNSSDPTLAIDLLAESTIHITGDVRANGGITATGAVIEGDERPGSGEVELPQVDLADFDPVNFGTPQGLPAAIPAELHLDGLVRHNGDVVLEKLSLPHDNTGALLWVDGNLTITDGVNGVGAIFATGNITILGAGHSNVNADNVCAVIAGDSLTVTGAGSQDSSFFQGVVASGGSLNLSKVTVAGAAASGATERNGNPVSTTTPDITLTDANMVNAPVNIDFKYDFLNGIIGASAGGVGQGWAAPNVPPSMSIDPRMVPEADLGHFFNPQTGDFEPGPGGSNDWTDWDGFGTYSYNEATHSRSGSPVGFFVGGNQLATRGDLEAQLYTIATNAGPITNGLDPGEPGCVTYATWDDYFADPSSQYHSMDELIDGLIRFNTNDPGNTENVMGKFAKYNTWYDAHPAQPQEEGSISFDPNQFVGWETRTKILLWREI